MPTIEEARIFWTSRVGNTHSRSRRLIQQAFRGSLQPKTAQDRESVENLAEGRLVCLWLAAAVEDPEWAQRVVAWTISRYDPAVQTAIAELVRLTTIGEDGE